MNAQSTNISPNHHAAYSFGEWWLSIKRILLSLLSGMRRQTSSDSGRPTSAITSSTMNGAANRPINRIIIEAIPHEQQRYDTAGDWYFTPEGELIIRVSADSANVLEDQNFLYAMHELVEVALCQKEGVTQEQVDQFDFAFEGESEPGDDPASPYRTQHRRAMLIEHLMASFMGKTAYGVVE